MTMRRILAIGLATICLGAVVAPVFAADEAVLPSAAQRFREMSGSPVPDFPVPDFQRHVAPLLGRLGCNGRSCHGSFQGRGDFRLSLFGYDFAMDHAALTARSPRSGELRVAMRNAEKSLLIAKPTEAVDHEGGKRFEMGSWEHHLLQRWIESGARGLTTPQVLSHLEFHPSEVVFHDTTDSSQLQVIAVWENGDREDVTPLCRFRTNDDSVATVDRDGLIHCFGAGDTHVIAFYDNGVAAVPVIRPIAQNLTIRERAAKTEVDRLVDQKLRKLGIRPSELCTDAEFLRRLSIDLTGTLPTPAEIESFLADQSPDKRQLKIDELLERPSYAAWWTNKLCDFTGCNPRQQAELGQETSVQWYMWIYHRLTQNVPYDELVAGIVLAKSRQMGQSYDDYASEVSSYFRDEQPLDFATRDTMPHYWTRRTMEKPEDKALAFAHNFLGIRLQCAQCHKHPFAPWTKEDFQQFSQLLSNVRFGVVPETESRYRELAKQVGLNVRGANGTAVRKDVLRRAQAGQTIPWRELYVARREQPVSLSLLRSEQIALGEDEDPREKILQWMTRPDNPWFARAFVNRVWAGYFHVGIVDPPDDLNPANPPSNPQLLDWLTAGFVDNDYDMKWLHRQIVSSDTYQRSWRPNETNRDDRRNFSRAIPRRIPAEVVYDGLKQAVAASERQEEVRTDLTRRATGHLSMWLAGTYGMHVFGKPERALNCDCERVNQPTLLQAIFMQNDPLVEQRIAESGWLAEIAAAETAGESLDTAQLIRAAWQRTVSRPPTAAETERARKHFEEVDSVAEGMEDLLWALVNTKEFVLNR